MFEQSLTLAVAIFWVLSPLFVHEMAHWVVLHRYRVPVIEHWLGLGPALFRVKNWRIGMLPLGAAVVPDPDKYHALTARQRMTVALAGPGGSLLYALVLTAVAWYQPADDAQVLMMVAGLNYLIAALNMLPVPPLDGFQAWVAWKEHQGKPLSPRTLNIAQRAGSGLVYGVGFFILSLALIRPF